MYIIIINFEWNDLAMTPNATLKDYYAHTIQNSKQIYFIPIKSDIGRLFLGNRVTLTLIYVISIVNEQKTCI